MTHIIEDVETRESLCGVTAPPGQSGPLCAECNNQFEEEWADE